MTSRTRARREAFAAERGIRAFDTVTELIEAVDLLYDLHAAVRSRNDCGGGPRARPARRGREALLWLLRDRQAVVSRQPVPEGAMLSKAVATCDRVLSRRTRGEAKIFYAENWVYAPAIQKEREILVKSAAQILWMIGEESHSGSHSPSYGVWAEAGGGSLVGKGCHPLTAALYLKQEEGRAGGGAPIRPVSVSARMHEITRHARYRSAGFLRTDYLDVEDYSQVHVVFEDGTSPTCSRPSSFSAASAHGSTFGQQPPDEVQPESDRRADDLQPA